MQIPAKTITGRFPLKTQRAEGEIMSRIALGLKLKHYQLTGDIFKTSGGDKRMYFANYSVCFQ